VTGWQTDTVAGGGYGNPIRPVGLICSIFRPSDDATIYPFLVPSNHFAVVSLRQLAEMIRALPVDGARLCEGRAPVAPGSSRGSQAEEPSALALADEAEALACEVEAALAECALAEHLDFGTVYPYEVDGFGNRLFMDDANIPSLLSMPYLGCCSPSDPVYRRTRTFILSDSNPYFFRGARAHGVGSPHTGLNRVWPLALIMRGLTSQDDREISWCLHTLKSTHGGTGFMHESFRPDDPTDFTRSWFAWANTLFGELVLKVHDERPHLLRA
jgi:meiotically up-regulated gene 157 (Mug157) protein